MFLRPVMLVASFAHSDCVAITQGGWLGYGNGVIYLMGPPLSSLPRRVRSLQKPTVAATVSAAQMPHRVVAGSKDASGAVILDAEVMIGRHVPGR